MCVILKQYTILKADFIGREYHMADSEWRKNEGQIDEK